MGSALLLALVLSTPGLGALDPEPPAYVHVDGDVEVDGNGKVDVEGDGNGNGNGDTVPLHLPVHVPDHGTENVPLDVPSISIAASPAVTKHLARPPASRLERLDISAALDRMAPRAPDARPLDVAPPRALPSSEAQPARVLSSSGAHAPASPPARASTIAPAGPAAPPPVAPASPDPIAVAAALLVLPLALALYHRLRGDAVANAGPRARILAMLATSPGLSASAIARVLEVDPSTAGYHLRRLQRERLVVSEGAGRAQRWALPGLAPHNLLARDAR